MSVELAVLLANTAATWFMCGVIWFVQLVHYPLFARYARDDFRATMLDHQRRTGRVVAGPMLVEFVTAVAVVVCVRDSPLPWIGVALVGVWVYCTALVQIPLHNQLTASGFDSETHTRLVHANWIRVVAWTARAALSGWLLAGGR